eukprot:1995411-Pleurochrysis_carterae.AAC.3
MAYRSGTRLTTVRKQAQARGLGAPTGVATVNNTQRAATASMREKGFQSLESGARALRKQAYGTTAKRETMHARDEMGLATTILRIVRRARVKKDLTIPPIALGVITLKNGSRVQIGYGSHGIL